MVLQLYTCPEVRNTAIHFAAGVGNTEVLQCLVNAKARVNVVAVNRRGISIRPLDIVLRGGGPMAAKILKQALSMVLTARPSSQDLAQRHDTMAKNRARCEGYKRRRMEEAAALNYYM